MLAQVGLSGSVRLGHGVMLAGQVGMIDHVTIGDRAQVGAQSGLHRDLPAGARVIGSPVVPATQWWRMKAVESRLPQVDRTIKRLDKRVTLLEKSRTSDSDS